MDQPLSVYRYPTLTMFLDDSPDFMHSLTFRMNSEIARKVFHHPLAALDWLRRMHRLCVENKCEPIQVSSDEPSASFERHGAVIDIGQIYRMVMNRYRFAMPAVLVIDYAMPEMNGIEFCRAIGDLPCKKILLTGHAEEKTVIEAFNRKLIDRFIRKNSLDAGKELDAAIVELQHEYFAEQGYVLKDLLSRDSYSFLADPAIEVLVQQLGSHYRFVEYYLFPHPAGILFIDIQGKATLLVIETDSSMITHTEIAQYQGAPPELLIALKELRLVPFFSDTEGMYHNLIGDDWLSYCLPAQVCHGRQDYYWALFDLPSHYLPGEVYSYSEFLREQATAAD